MDKTDMKESLRASSGGGSGGSASLATQAMFTHRIVNVDFYSTFPCAGLDSSYSEFRSKDVTRVPVLRIFGSTPQGQKTCAHIHGAFPYITIPDDPSIDNLDQKIARGIDTAVNEFLGSAATGRRNYNPSTQQHVFKVKRVIGRTFYGFRSTEEAFLRIYFYNPLVIKKVADLLLNGSILNKIFQPYEAHIPYQLQFMIDFNLYGMNLVHYKSVKFRRNKEVASNDVNHAAVSVKQSLISSSGVSKYWDLSQLPENMYSPPSLEKTTTCELEVDILASDIIVSPSQSAVRSCNPGIDAIWQDEMERRKQHEETNWSQITVPESQARVYNGEMFPTESNFRRLLEEKLNSVPYDEMSERFQPLTGHKSDWVPCSQVEVQTPKTNSQVRACRKKMQQSVVEETEDDELLQLFYEMQKEKEDLDKEEDEEDVEEMEEEHFESSVQKDVCEEENQWEQSFLSNTMIEDLMEEVETADNLISIDESNVSETRSPEPNANGPSSSVRQSRRNLIFQGDGQGGESDSGGSENGESSKKPTSVPKISRVSTRKSKSQQKETKELPSVPSLLETSKSMAVPSPSGRLSLANRRKFSSQTSSPNSQNKNLALEDRSSSFSAKTESPNKSSGNEVQQSLIIKSTVGENILPEVVTRSRSNSIISTTKSTTNRKSNVSSSSTSTSNVKTRSATHKVAITNVQHSDLTPSRTSKRIAIRKSTVSTSSVSPANKAKKTTPGKVTSINTPKRQNKSMSRSSQKSAKKSGSLKSQVMGGGQQPVETALRLQNIEPGFSIIDMDYPVVELERCDSASPTGSFKINSKKSELDISVVEGSDESSRNLKANAELAATSSSNTQSTSLIPKRGRGRPSKTKKDKAKGSFKNPRNSKRNAKQSEVRKSIEILDVSEDDDKETNKVKELSNNGVLDNVPSPQITSTESDAGHKDENVLSLEHLSVSKNHENVQSLEDQAESVSKSHENVQSLEDKTESVSESDENVQSLEDQSASELECHEIVRKEEIIASLIENEVPKDETTRKEKSPINVPNPISINQAKSEIIVNHKLTNGKSTHSVSLQETGKETDSVEIKSQSDDLKIIDVSISTEVVKSKKTREISVQTDDVLFIGPPCRCNCAQPQAQIYGSFISIVPELTPNVDGKSVNQEPNSNVPDNDQLLPLDNLNGFEENHLQQNDESIGEIEDNFQNENNIISPLSSQIKSAKIPDELDRTSTPLPTSPGPNPTQPESLKIQPSPKSPTKKSPSPRKRAPFFYSTPAGGKSPLKSKAAIRSSIKKSVKPPGYKSFLKQVLNRNRQRISPQQDKDEEIPHENDDLFVDSIYEYSSPTTELDDISAFLPSSSLFSEQKEVSYFSIRKSATKSKARRRGLKRISRNLEANEAAPDICDDEFQPLKCPPTYRSMKGFYTRWKPDPTKVSTVPEVKPTNSENLFDENSSDEEAIEDVKRCYGESSDDEDDESTSNSLNVSLANSQQDALSPVSSNLHSQISNASATPQSIIQSKTRLTENTKRKLLWEHDKPRKKSKTGINSVTVEHNTTLDSNKAVNISELDGMSPKNQFGFEHDMSNLQDAKALHQHQYLTIMSVEVHCDVRGDLTPDPMQDPIVAIFIFISNDVPDFYRQPKQLYKCLLTHPVVPAAKSSDSKCQYYLNENDLLDGFFSIYSDWDPDILVGYETEKFSWGYIISRGMHIGREMIPALSRLLPRKKSSYHSEKKDGWDGNICGRIVLNLWRLLRHEIAVQSYTYENTAYHILHRKVCRFSHKMLAELWNDAKNRWRVLDYFKERVKGVIELMNKLDLINRTSELARLFGIQFYEVFSRGSQFRVESMMLRAAKPLNFIAVSPGIAQRSKMRAPEFVPLILEPMSCYYTDPVAVLDFQSLYPSMIMAYNYDYATVLGRVEHLGKDGLFDLGCLQTEVPPYLLHSLKDHIHISPAGVAFVDSSVRKGILPEMLEQILETRQMVKRSMKKWKKEGATLQKILDSRQLGLKLIANVTYGYTSANFSGRMPCIEIADSVVSKGRETLQRAINLVKSNEKRWGGHVIYGDTDSIFIRFPGKTREDAFRLGQEIADEVTQANPKPVKLKFEKIYQPCILQSKKRYVGYSYETPDQEQPTYDAKGIETVRRDGCPAVKKILEKSLHILFTTNDPEKVKTFVQLQFRKLFTGRVSMKEYTFARAFRGRDGYKPGACVPALEIAKRAIEKDPRAEPLSKERVPYVVVYGKPTLPLIKLVRTPVEFVSDYTLRLNAHYYIEKAIIPALNRCFALAKIDVSKWYKNLPRKYLRNILEENKTGQGTLDEYVHHANCFRCDERTEKGVCLTCDTDLQKTSLFFVKMSSDLAKKLETSRQICEACSNNDDKCLNTDCPVFHKLLRYERDDHYNRQLLLKLKDIEEN